MPTLECMPPKNNRIQESRGRIYPNVGKVKYASLTYLPLPFSAGVRVCLSIGKNLHARLESLVGIFHGRVTAWPGEVDGRADVYSDKLILRRVFSNLCFSS